MCLRKRTEGIGSKKMKIWVLMEIAYAKMDKESRCS